MKGYISVEIPTKSYIKAYVYSQLGDKPVMQRKSLIGSKLLDFLDHKTDESCTNYSNLRYNATLKLYVSHYTFRQRGAFINYTNVKTFNLFVERIIKKRFRFYMDYYISIKSSFEAHLPEVRKRLGIDLEAWNDDSMKKDYYRYRQYTGKALLYNKSLNKLSQKTNDKIFQF